MNEENHRKCVWLCTRENKNLIKLLDEQDVPKEVMNPNPMTLSHHSSEESSISQCDQQLVTVCPTWTLDSVKVTFHPSWLLFYWTGCHWNDLEMSSRCTFWLFWLVHFTLLRQENWHHQVVLIMSPLMAIHLGSTKQPVSKYCSMDFQSVQTLLQFNVSSRNKYLFWVQNGGEKGQCIG